MQTEPRTGAECVAIVTDLRQRREANRMRVSAIAEERKGHALSASLGDEAALEELRRLDEEEATLARSERNFDAALAQAEGMRDLAQAREKEERRVAQIREAHGLAADVLEVDRRIDATFAAAVEALKEREALMGRLVATGVMDDTVAMNHSIQVRSTMASAMVKAGMDRWLPTMPGLYPAVSMADHDRGYIRPPVLPPAAT